MITSWLLRYLVSLLFFCSSTGLLFTHPQELPGSQQYDFIIGVAGTAGALIASHLSKSIHASVLLVEAGPFDHSDTLSIPWFASQATPNTPFDWNDTSAAQVGLLGRKVPIPRGHVLGGSSSINNLVYTCPSMDDYRQFAEVTRDQGWTWDSLFPYMIKNEHHVESADKHNTSSQFIPALHGFHGPLLTSLPGNPTDVDNRVLQTTTEFNSTFPYNIDMNSGFPIGTGWIHGTIGNSRHSSSSTGGFKFPCN